MRLNVALPTLFAMLTLCLSAALMFSVQLLLGKALLPATGGMPQVWLACLAFFQILLLVGYGASHLATRLSARTHGLALAALAVLALLTLPVPVQFPQLRPITDVWELMRLLGALLAAVGLPFLVLSCMAPTVQRLYAAYGHPGAEDPYFLYAASNAGSFLGLLGYPLLVEPLWGLQAQADIWLWGFGALAVLLLTAVFRKSPAAPELVAAAARRAGEATRLPRWRWFLLALVPSSLNLGVTSFISTDIAAFPLLWALPLALYLLSYVLAFLKRPLLPTRDLALMQAILSAVFFAVHFSGGVDTLLIWMMLLLLGTYFMTCWLLHQHLAELRPPPARLTEFYFFLALGGACGAVFNAFLAPVLFVWPVEMALAFVAALWLSPGFMQRLGVLRWVSVGAFVVALLTVPLIPRLSSFPVLAEMMAYAPWLKNLLLGVGVVAAALVAFRPKWLGGFVLAVLAAAALFPPTAVLYQGRDYFGTYRVIERQQDDLDPARSMHTRKLEHGTTLHGAQLLFPHQPLTREGYVRQGIPLLKPDLVPAPFWRSAQELFPQTYYPPVLRLQLELQSRAIGVVGLGVGSVACLSMNFDAEVTFFEINPNVVELAQTYFTYLRNCPPVRMVLGDARQQLALDTARYDLLVLDAFSSDAIPMHLLTAEALAVYRARLAPGGVVAFHISNRHFALAPPLARLAQAAGMAAWLKDFPRHDFKEFFATNSIWLVMTQAGDAVAAPRLQGLGFQRVCADDEAAWTDDFVPALSALKIFSPKIHPREDGTCPKEPI